MSNRKSYKRGECVDELTKSGLVKLIFPYASEPKPAAHKVIAQILIHLSSHMGRDSQATIFIEVLNQPKFDYLEQAVKAVVTEYLALFVL